MNANEVVDAIIGQIECAGAKRVVGAAGHAILVTAVEFMFLKHVSWKASKLAI